MENLEYSIEKILIHQDSKLCKHNKFNCRVKINSEIIPIHFCDNEKPCFI
jgi:hypothetical protein